MVDTLWVVMLNVGKEFVQSSLGVVVVGDMVRNKECGDSTVVDMVKYEQTGGNGKDDLVEDRCGLTLYQTPVLFFQTSDACSLVLTFHRTADGHLV